MCCPSDTLRAVLCWPSEHQRADLCPNDHQRADPCCPSDQRAESHLSFLIGRKSLKVPLSPCRLPPSLSPAGGPGVGTAVALTCRPPWQQTLVLATAAREVWDWGWGHHPNLLVPTGCSRCHRGEVGPPIRAGSYWPCISSATPSPFLSKWLSWGPGCHRWSHRRGGDRGGLGDHHAGPCEGPCLLSKEKRGCRKVPFSLYLNLLNISRRNIHCTLMVKRYKFITFYKNYHLKEILFILIFPTPIAK